MGRHRAAEGELAQRRDGAWLRDRTDSVVPGMFVHALFNAAALLVIVAG